MQKELQTVKILIRLLCKMSRDMTKPNEMSVRPVNTDQPESSLWTQWVAKNPSCLHADSEDSDQTGRMPRLICHRWAHTHFVGFVMSRLKSLIGATNAIICMCILFLDHVKGY